MKLLSLLRQARLGPYLGSVRCEHTHFDLDAVVSKVLNITSKQSAFTQQASKE